MPPWRPRSARATARHERAGDRRGQDDAPVAPLTHRRQAGLDGVDDALDVDVHDAVPVGIPHRIERDRRMVDPGVGREDVDAPVALEHVRPPRRERRAVDDIGLHGPRVVTGGSQCFGRTLARGRVDVDQHDPRTLPGQHLGDAQADATRGARDNRDSPAQVLHPSPLAVVVCSPVLEGCTAACDPSSAAVRPRTSAVWPRRSARGRRPGSLPRVPRRRRRRDSSAARPGRRRMRPGGRHLRRVIGIAAEQVRAAGAAEALLEAAVRVPPGLDQVASLQQAERAPVDARLGRRRVPVRCWQRVQWQ